ncbi:hypothetical protein EO087_08545 [Dyella sp. M7H15-1]|uniref:hypothetical protein n=1 Tax=Dyella sp. M7H15-1 TaxID=2501295 RepID=UPI001004D835|nr:hypothetical protein [Dyella sp. M7H15-1]QAU24034.1 hypothetical protein EO087_08545 [Dyella sp. M7H15-1]
MNGINPFMFSPQTDSTDSTASQEDIIPWETIGGHDNRAVKGPTLVKDCAKVVAELGADVTAQDEATIWANSGSTVDAFDGATVYAYEDATVNAQGESIVTVYPGSYVTAGTSATAKLKDGAQLNAEEGAVVHMPNGAVVVVTGDTHLTLTGQELTVNGGSVRMAASGEGAMRICTIGPSRGHYAAFPVHNAKVQRPDWPFDKSMPYLSRACRHEVLKYG